MLFEFREYSCLPGKRDTWVKYMEETIVPFQTSKGVVILGMWVSETDPDLYYWLRRFENEAERVRIYDAVYKSDIWVKEMGPAVGLLIDRTKIKVTRMLPTPMSVIQ